MVKTDHQIHGLPVYIAEEPIEIHITPADVKEAALKDPERCAAALACLHRKGVVAARIHLGRIYVSNGKRWMKYKTSGRLRTEIVAFDRGGSFEPGIYKLNVLPPSSRVKQHVGGNGQTLKPSKVSKRRFVVHQIAGVRARASKK